MKKYLLSGFIKPLIFLLIVILSSQGKSNDNNEDIIKDESFVIEVDGLACPFCAYGLEKKLISLKNIDTLTIDINEGLVEVFLQKDKQISKKEIHKKVEEAGFTLRKFIISGKEFEVKNKNEKD